MCQVCIPLYGLNALSICKDQKSVLSDFYNNVTKGKPFLKRDLRMDEKGKHPRAITSRPYIF